MIIYDIVNDKKRKKIADIIDGYGIRVQYSSYEVWLTEKQLQKLLEQVRKICDVEDSIRIYKLSQKPSVIEGNLNSHKLQYDIAICD